MACMDIVLIGARGLARELLGYLEDDPRYRVICALDEDTSATLPGCEVMSPSDWRGHGESAIFTVGYPEFKREVLERYARFDFQWQTYIHPQAIISKHANVGIGCIFAPFAVVAGNASLGNFVFMNVYSAVGHDSSVGSFSSLMPYACAEGYASVGEECLIATGAKVLPHFRIGDRSRVSAGAVVMRDMPQDTLIHGNPATHQADIVMLRRRKKAQQDR